MSATEEVRSGGRTVILDTGPGMEQVTKGGDIQQCPEEKDTLALSNY